MFCFLNLFDHTNFIPSCRQGNSISWNTLWEKFYMSALTDTNVVFISSLPRNLVQQWLYARPVVLHVMGTHNE